MSGAPFQVGDLVRLVTPLEEDDVVGSEHVVSEVRQSADAWYIDAKTLQGDRSAHRFKLVLQAWERELLAASTPAEPTAPALNAGDLVKVTLGDDVYQGRVRETRNGDRQVGGNQIIGYHLGASVAALARQGYAFEVLETAPPLPTAAGIYLDAHGNAWRLSGMDGTWTSLEGRGLRVPADLVQIDRPLTRLIPEEQS